MTKKNNNKDIRIVTKKSFEVTAEDGTRFGVAIYDGDTQEDLVERKISALALYDALANTIKEKPNGESALGVFLAFSKTQEDFPDLFENEIHGWFLGVREEGASDDAKQQLIFLTPDHFKDCIKPMLLEFDKWRKDQGISEEGEDNDG